MATTRAPTTRRRLPPEERRRRILDSALATFSERGYHAASVEEIARGAGITKAVVYDHFQTKRQVYDAVVAAEQEALFAKLDPLLQPGDLRRRVERFAEVFLAHIRDRPQSRRIMLETVDAEPDVGRAQRANQMLATRAFAAVLAQEPDVLPRAPDRDVALEMLGQMLKSAVNGLADWWYDHPEVAQAVVAQRLVDFLLGGLSAFRAT